MLNAGLCKNVRIIDLTICIVPELFRKLIPLQRSWFNAANVLNRIEKNYSVARVMSISILNDVTIETVFVQYNKSNETHIN